MRLSRCAVIALAFFIGGTQLSWAKGLHITEYPIPTPNSQASYIAAEPDGNIWFTEANGQKVARITPQGVITEFRPVPANPIVQIRAVDPARRAALARRRARPSVRASRDVGERR